jgi:hypothetical protein
MGAMGHRLRAPVLLARKPRMSAPRWEREPLWFPAETEGVVADGNIAIAEPGLRPRPERVEPQLEKEPPVPEALGDPRTLHCSDVVEVHPVHGLPEAVPDPSQPIGLQGFVLLVREALAMGKPVHMVDLHISKRPIVRKAVDPAEGHSSKAVVQALQDRFGSFA